MNITLVAAMTEDRVIGKNGEMPWHIPEELDHFHNYIEGKTVIMGRKTFQNTGAFDDCYNIVLSESLSEDEVDEDVSVAESKHKAVTQALYQQNEICVIGGESVYYQFLHYADKMVLSLVDRNVSGDKHFPVINYDGWGVKEQKIRNHFTVMYYERE